MSLVVDCHIFILSEVKGMYIGLLGGGAFQSGLLIDCNQLVPCFSPMFGPLSIANFGCKQRCFRESTSRISTARKTRSPSPTLS